MKDNKKIAVLIPVFNEGAVIGSVLQQLISLDYTIIIVDDSSTDGLADQIADLPVHYLRHPINLGQGAALQTGFKYASGLDCTHVVTFDADGQHLAADIPRLLEVAVDKNLDIVFGSRFMGEAIEIPLSRRILLQCARWFNYMTTGILMTDAHNGLRILKKEALSNIQLKQNRMAYATELLDEIKRLDYSYGEGPVTIVYTDYSKQKGQSNWNAINIAWHLFVQKLHN